MVENGIYQWLRAWKSRSAKSCTLSMISWIWYWPQSTSLRQYWVSRPQIWETPAQPANCMRWTLFDTGRAQEWCKRHRLKEAHEFCGSYLEKTNSGVWKRLSCDSATAQPDGADRIATRTLNLPIQWRRFMLFARRHVQSPPLHLPQYFQLPTLSFLQINLMYVRATAKTSCVAFFVVLCIISCARLLGGESVHWTNI